MAEALRRRCFDFISGADATTADAVFAPGVGPKCRESGWESGILDDNRWIRPSRLSSVALSPLSTARYVLKMFIKIHDSDMYLVPSVALPADAPF